MEKRVFIALMFFVLVGSISAETIFYNNFSNTYSIGDIISVNFSIMNNFSASSYLESYLMCDDSETLIFKEFNFINKNTKKFFNFEILADKPGKCKIKTKFGSTTDYSDSFEISDKINIHFKTNDKSFYPLDIMSLNGTVQKANGENVTGFIRIMMDEIINKSIEINKGRFSADIQIPENALPRKYVLKLEVNQNGNSGIEEQEIVIKQKPSFLQIISNETFVPEGDFPIRVNLLDQAKNFLGNYSILVRIFNPFMDIYFEKTVNSGENFSVYFPSNSTKGRWDINAYYGNVFANKPLYISENPELKTEIIEQGGFLKVTNIGNVDYEGVLEVEIEKNNDTRIVPVNINLSVGESKTYPLGIEENGTYNLVIGNKKFENVTVLGTGAAVSQNFKSLNLKSYFYIFLILFFIGIVFLIRKKRWFKKIKLSSKKPEKPEEVAEVFEQKSFPESKKRIYICFINSPKFDKIKEISEKYNYSLEKISENLSFVLFYSSDEQEKNNLLYFAKELKNKIRGISLVIHSDIFEGKISSLKTAFLTKEIVKRIRGIFITEDFYNLFPRLRVGNSRVFSVKEKYIKVFELVI